MAPFNNGASSDDPDFSSSTPRPIPPITTAGRPRRLTERGEGLEDPSSYQKSQTVSSEYPRANRAHSISQQLPSFNTSLDPFGGFLELSTAHSKDAVNTLKAASPPSKRTAPIAIPQRKIDPEAVITPLSGRPRRFDDSAFAAFQSSHASEKSAHSPNTRSCYSSSQGSQSSTDDSLGLSPRQPGHISHMHRGPPSPLAPTMSSRSANTEQEPRPGPRNPHRPPHGLNLSNLPRYQPPNLPNTDANVSSSGRNTFRNLSSQSRPYRPGSDAQQKLQQYQRDYVANLKRTANPSQSFLSTPESPRLAPLGSPGGPMTPLLLEAQSDYLIAGSRNSSPGSSTGREIVEKLVRKENERRQHPEAGSVSPAMSPALSPAVSPAGGRI